ncbi:hypothetical protein GGQ63_003657 [Prosthecomicrobium pneumaticum]|uniref:Uncharacterized protein n=1 Tax=Prosthecomicrobium pneumaticum TaxID=81895 RepID=A0A7W9L3J2_9HYPH|nr:hypothetical protein [Prosthecomicrobium pneumaticum]
MRKALTPTLSRERERGSVALGGVGRREGLSR